MDVCTSRRPIDICCSSRPASSSARGPRRTGSGRPSIRSLLAEVWRKDNAADDAVVEREFVGESRRVVVSARRFEVDDSSSWVLLALEDDRHGVEANKAS
jgi:hypothetical protein